MALAAGINAALALHVLGAAPRVPTREFQRFLPAMWFGFWLNVASGIALFLAYPTKALTNPIFWLKLTLIAIAMWVFVRLRRRVLFAAQAEPIPWHRDVPVMAAASLACWAGAIIAGRLLAYTYTRLLATW